MASVEVITEIENGPGWDYRAAVVRDSGVRTEHSVRLAWVDHEHWCGGRAAPSRVIEVLLGLMAEREREQPIPERFDASTARRLVPRLDEALRNTL